MTSHLDDGGLHPMVSTLLGGGTILTVSVKTYNRERMMELRATKPSMTRPENLSEEYNGDDGKFSPLKWLEHRWEIEGIKNRPMSKKIDSLCAGADENTGLSPQRRAFSSGCKAPTDEKGRDGEYERLGGHGKNWRNGSTGGADKFASRGINFKTAFQKGTLPDRGSRAADWTKDAARGAKFGQRREDRLTSVSGSEKLPEWADGPTTIDDMIELHGFDEPKKGKSKKDKKEKKEKETVKQSDSSECNVSCPSSTGMKPSDPIDDPAVAFSSTGGGTLPATDQELAALLGCLDIQKSSRKGDGDDITWTQKNEETAGGTSRLSRFFGKKSKSPELESMLAASVGGGNDENVANPMIAKLFAHSGGDTNASSSGLSDVKEGMRLEDLEKGIEAKEQSRQAQLAYHLQKFAKQQTDSFQNVQHHRQPTPPSGGPLHQQVPYPMVHHGIPIVADPALLASFAQNPLVLNAYVENQLQEAINAAIRANNGQQLPAQLHEQLRMASIRNKAFLQSQTLAFVTLQQQHHNLQHQHQQQQKGRPPAMIPASVQRQLHKSTDQKREKSSQSPPENAQEHADVQTQSEAMNQLKKLHMQQNYASMVQAMNSGVGWTRSNGSVNGQQQPQQLQPNVQMLMAQHQQAQMQHLKMMMSRAQQQHLLMAKLAHMQQQQQQAQMASMPERQGSSHPPQLPQQSMPSELSQVGPIQTPLEKLLASVGVQGSQFTGSGDRIPASVRPMALEDLEKQLMAVPK